MIDIFRQGSGNKNGQFKRVDISTGRMLSTADKSQSKRKLEVEQRAWQRQLIVRALAAMLFVAAVIMISGCASAPPAKPPSIQIESVRITAAGHYIDLRYRVLDPEAANASLGPGVKPTLTDEASGIVMAVPMTAKLGSLRQTRGQQRPDRNYFVLFANTAGVQSGSRVTAELGDMTFENLTIE